MSKESMKEMLEMIDAKINHIEDITADDRALLIKLVKQNNTIVKFLSQIEIEDITDDYVDKPSNTSSEKIKEMRELIDEYLSKQHDLVEFEKEMSKHKDKLTPGIVGES